MPRFVSWNVNGLRAIQKKGLWESLEILKPDVFSFQETKSDPEVMKIQAEIFNKKNFCLHYHSATLKKGYSGVATGYFQEFKDSETLDLFQTENSDDNGLEKSIQSSKNSDSQKQKNLFDSELVQTGVMDPEFDIEGRLVVTKHIFGNKKLVLLNGYHPQGGRGPHRIDYKIRFYKKVLDIALDLKKQGYLVLLCGDFNTTVADIDLARPKENRKTTGCLPQEREALNLFFDNGFIDSFRYLYPDKPDVYTYWDQITRARERNVGWRIDYFMVDKDLLGNLREATVHSDIYGSDHCPVSIDLEF